MIHDWEYYRFKILGSPSCKDCGEGLTLEMSLKKYYCPVCDKEEIAKLIKNSKDYWVKSRVKKLKDGQLMKDLITI